MAKCVRITVSNSSVDLAGTDLEVAVRCRVPAEVHREGAVVVPARHLSEIVRRAPEGIMEVQSDSSGAVLTYPGGEVKLSGFAPDEFPPLVAEDKQGDAVALGKDFRAALRCTLYAAGKDELRPVFTGLHVEFRDGRMSLVATDTHRLAAYEAPADAPTWFGIVPAKALREVERAMLQAEDTAAARLEPSWAAFSTEKVEVATRLIEGRFPEWRQAVPGDPARTQVKVDAGVLAAVLERARVLVEGESPVVLLKLSDGALTVLSRSDLGEFREAVSVEAAGEDVEVAFNVTYLLDALRVVPDAVEVSFNGSTGPAVLRSPGLPGCLAVVLPLRLI